MKRRKALSIFYAVISVVAIVAIVLTLIFVPKDDKSQTNENGNSETYATSFSVNLPNKIEILLNTKAVLKNYISVVPAEMESELTYEVKVKSTGTDGGINFENNKISALAVGEYSIQFKMPKSSSSYFSKTISIGVFEDVESAHITQKATSIKVDETRSLSDMFSIKENANYSVTTDGTISFDNNNFLSQTEGESEIEFVFEESNVSYIYNFNLLVNPKPQYTIVLNNVTNNTIEFDLSNNDVFHISYNVKDGNMENVSQSVNAISNDTSIILIESVDSDNLIKIRAVAIGETIIKIYITTNNNIAVNINVKVI